MLSDCPPTSAYDQTAMPAIEIGGETVYVDILGILNIPIERLGEVVGTARDQRDRILRAMDWLVHTGPALAG